MLRVGGDEDVAPDVYAGTGTFLERDDRQAIQEVVQYLLTLGGRLLGDPAAYLRRGRKHAAVITDLRQST